MKFRNAVTGSEVGAREGSRLAAALTASDDWVKVPAKTAKQKEASDGSSNSGGRGAASRKAAQRKRSSKG